RRDQAPARQPRREQEVERPAPACRRRQRERRNRDRQQQRKHRERMGEGELEEEGGRVGGEQVGAQQLVRELEEAADQVGLRAVVGQERAHREPDQDRRERAGGAGEGVAPPEISEEGAAHGGTPAAPEVPSRWPSPWPSRSPSPP